MTTTQLLAVAFVVTANALALNAVAAASASGSLQDIPGILILLAFVGEGLVLYWNQDKFRRKPK